MSLDAPGGNWFLDVPGGNVSLDVPGGNVSLTSFTCHASGSRWSTQAVVVCPQSASHTAHGIKHNASQGGT